MVNTVITKSFYFFLMLLVTTLLSAFSDSYIIQAKSTVEKNSQPFPFGLVNGCRKLPKFIQTLKMRAPALDSRQDHGVMGLIIRDVSQKDKTWQHPSWLQSGFIGSFDRDEEGNIYVSPQPYISLLENPSELQNRLYKIDKDTAKMEFFMELPAHSLPNKKNPFGAMAMAFDCDTQSLYVSSLAGSEPRSANGAIYQIDLKTKKVISSFKNTDAMGLNVFNHKGRKTLYFGSARNPYLYSIELDSKGRFKNKKKYELSLTELEGGDTTVVKKITFLKSKNQYYMKLKEREFGFRLFAENKPFKKTYIFGLNPIKATWDFKGITKE